MEEGHKRFQFKARQTQNYSSISWPPRPPWPAASRAIRGSTLYIRETDVSFRARTDRRQKHENPPESVKSRILMILVVPGSKKSQTTYSQVYGSPS